MSKFHIHIIITALAIILFLPGLGLIHLFDWDEINFAEAAREMIVTKNYLTVQIRNQYCLRHLERKSFCKYVLQNN